MELVAHHVELELEKCDQQPDRKQEYINLGNLQIFVDKLVKNQILLPWMPRALKREMFFNMLQLLLSVLHVVLSATELDILGHKVSISFSTAPAIHQQAAEFAADPVCVMAYVDKCLSSETTNLWYIPDFIERPLLFTIQYMAVTILLEVFVDFRLNVLGDQVKFNMVRGAMPSVRDMSDEQLKAHRLRLKKEQAATQLKIDDLKFRIQTTYDGLL
jgi:hypothetical protein